MAIKERIQHIQQIIKEAELAYKRDPNSVLLLAVSKQQSAEVIEQAYNLGLNQFGENYYQEAEEKIKKLSHLALIWHFIGPVQSNKTKGIAKHFSWVHSINRFSIAEGLNKHRPADKAPLNVCLQINLVEEASKSGIDEREAFHLARAVSKLPQLQLRGLMTIPPPQSDLDKQYRIFLKLKQLKDELNSELDLDMDTLSMGMSDDLRPAIYAGATIVRIGRAIFGERG